MLNECSPLVNVEQLAAVGDCVDGLLSIEGELQNAAVGFFPSEVWRPGKARIHWSVFAGLDVSGAAGKHKGVECRNQSVAGHLVFQGNDEPLAASSFDSLEIILSFARRTAVCGLFFLGGSAPRDAHTGAAGGARLGTSRGHGTPNRSIRNGGRQPIGERPMVCDLKKFEAERGRK